MTMMRYKEYEASGEFDEEAEIFHGDARSIVRSSNGKPANAMSRKTSFEAQSNKTRFSKANSAASGRRVRNLAVSIWINSSSFPKPVRRVRSASTVRRGSPHRCTAMPPMKQKRYFWAEQTACNSSAAWKTLLMTTRLPEDSLLFD